MHQLNRRQIVAAGMAATLGTAYAQDYPSKVIRLVVPFPAGGPTDAISRHLANDWQTRLGWRLIVDNKPGATGHIAHEDVRRQPPDGYTLMALVNPAVVNYKLMAKPFSLPSEFAPLGRVYTQYLVVVVNPQAPGMDKVHTLKDLMSLAKEKGGNVSFTSAGNGSMGHLSTLALCNRAGVSMTHVPYKGDAPAINDVLGGTVGLMNSSATTALPHIRSGKLRPIAVSSASRVPDLPDVPTFAESGFTDIVAAAWFGLVAPPNMPAPLVDGLTKALKDSLSTPTIQQKFQDTGVTPAYLPPTEFGEFVNRDFSLWSKVIVDNNIQTN